MMSPLLVGKKPVSGLSRLPGQVEPSGGDEWWLDRWRRAGCWLTRVKRNLIIISITTGPFGSAFFLRNGAVTSIASPAPAVVCGTGGAPPLSGGSAGGRVRHGQEKHGTKPTGDLHRFSSMTYGFIIRK